MKSFFRSFATLILVLLLILLGYFVWDVLRDKGINEQLAEIIHQEDRRELNTQLTSYLNSDSPEVRRRAILAVGRIGGKKAAELLFELISDPSSDIAATAVFALGLTGENQYAAQLMDIAPDMNAGTLVSVVEATGRLADSSMHAVIADLFGELSHPSPQVREAAAMALFRADARSRAADLAKVAANEQDTEVRQALLFTLARFAAPEGEKLYVEFLADSDPFIRSLAVRGIARVDNPEADHYLAIACNDADPNVVAQTIVELGRKKTREARKLLTKKLEQMKDRKLIASTIAAIQRQDNKEAGPTVEDVMHRLDDPGITAAAVRCLTTLEGDRAIVLIDSLAENGTPYVRAAAAEAYQLLHKPSIIPRLAVLFSDEDGMVRRAALDALAEIDSSNADYYIKKALNDPDYVVVVTAIDIISRAKLADYLPTLQVMSSRGAELDIDLRRSLVDLSRSFLEENKENEEAKAILMEGALDREYVVRREAAAVYRDVLGEDRTDFVRTASTRFSIGDIEDGLDDYKINPHALIITEHGTIDIELYFDLAPLTVLNFINLAEKDFYNGLTFHRVIPNFVVQGGDPRGDGWGGPDYYIRCEYSSEPYIRGTVGVATSGKDTGGSQFFVTLSPQPHLDGRYTVFGQVVEGMEVVDQLAYGDLIEKIVIEKREK